MELILFVIVAALAFEYINGFNDTACAIATSVSTKVLTPRQAVLMAALFNLGGALVGVSVAATIGRGLVDTSYVTPVTVFSALFAAIIWDLTAWWLGIPCSSSHALIGGLCGATLAAAHEAIDMAIIAPADIIDVLRKKLADLPLAIRYEPSESVDVTVTAGQTRIETRLKAWIDLIDAKLE